MSKKTINCTQIGTSNTLSIEAISDQAQVLITLRRNESQWLSPAGWSDSEKGTLLDCNVKSERTLIDIPAEFSAQLKTGDSLHIHCDSLGVSQTLEWSAPKIETTAASNMQNSASTVTATSSVTKGLFARFKGEAETRAPNPDMSDVERQAQAAQKAAADMRTKMETAQAAKEAAHQRAIEAARLAEEARKAEEAQIAQMEAVERNLREAEAAHHEELARMEEERRAEEARKVEAARLAEEARQLEDMRRQKAVLAKRREALAHDLEIEVEARRLAQNHADKLIDTLANHDVKADRQSLDMNDAQSATSMAEMDLVKTETNLLGAQETLETLTAEQARDEQTLDMFASEKAQAETSLEAAKAEAIQARQVLEQAKARMKKAENDVETLSKNVQALSLRETELSAQSQLKSESLITAQTQAEHALSQFETAQLSQAKALQSEKALLAETKILQGSRAELDLKLTQAKDELSVIVKREQAMRKAIDMIDGGKSLNDVDTVLSDMPGLYKAPKPDSAANDAPGLLGGFKRKIAASRFSGDGPTLYADEPGKNTAPLSIVSKDAEALPVAENDSSDLRKALVASVAAIAFVAVVGYSASKLTPATASAPKPVDMIKAEETKTPEPSFDLETLKTSKAAEAETDEVETVTPIADEAIKKAKASVDISVSDAALKMAHDASVLTKEETPIVASLEKRSEKLVSETKTDLIAVPTIKPVQGLNASKPGRPAISERVRQEQKAKLKTVQSDLQTLGFYDGKIDGFPGENTDAAIIEFKTLFGLPKNTLVTPRFTHELSEAKNQILEAKLTPPEPIIFAQPVVEAEPMSMPAVEPVNYVSTPIIVEPTPEPVQTASLTPIAEPEPEPVDVVIDAERLSAWSAEYPKKVLRRDFYKTVTVALAYDIDATGGVSDVKVLSVSDEAGRYRKSFAQAGIKAVSKQRFTPKSINGEAVESTGLKTKIVFRTE